MKALLLLLAVLALYGCAAPMEGERFLVAGVLEVEGLAWRVKCGETTQRMLNERQLKALQNVAADDLENFEFTGISIGRVAVGRDHYWASKRLEACEGKRRW